MLSTPPQPPTSASGEVAEWLNAPHSKCGIRATVSGVRIPPSPPADPGSDPDTLTAQGNPSSACALRPPDRYKKGGTKGMRVGDSPGRRDRGTRKSRRR